MCMYSNIEQQKGRENVESMPCNERTTIQSPSNNKSKQDTWKR